MTHQPTEKTLIACTASYIALIVFSNLGSLRIISLAGLSLDGGTLLYPFSFTARDILHKKCGAELTRYTIILAAILNLLLFAFVWLIGILPADTSVGPQHEYAAVLAPGMRLVLASIVGMTVSELLDTVIYSAVRHWLGTRLQFLRVLLSNAISVPVDSAIFVLIAFVGRYDTATLLAIFVGNIIIKYAVAVLACGAIYLVKEDND